MERVWRMPLGPEYDKMIDSKFADMKNTGGRYGGSITAAQFLQRFVDKTPWAHLDIAGTGIGLAAERHQQELELGLGRAAAQSTRRGSLRAMTEVLFYHLQRQPLERVLPQLLERSYERAAGASWCRRRPTSASTRSTRICGPIATTVSCRTAPPARAEAAAQPILLTTADHNPNGATVRFLIDGVPMPPDARAYERIVLLFDGEDEDAVAAARARWARPRRRGSR